MPQCNHNKKADIWTKVGAFGETAGAITLTFLFAFLMEDLIKSTSNKTAGVSTYALIAGGLLAIVTTLGSTFTHYRLNKNHQEHSHGDSSHEHHHEEEAHHEEKCEHSGHPHAHGSARLSCHEYSSLGGDLVAHTGEYAEPNIFVLKLVSKGRLPYPLKLGINLGILALSGISAWAGVRSCKNSMLSEKGIGESKINRADCWTKIEAAAELIRLPSNTYWIAEFIDLIYSTEDKVLGFSTYAFKLGLLISIFATLGTMHSIYLLNKGHQHIPQYSHDSQTPLTTLQKISLAGTGIVFAGIFAEPIIFAAELASENLSRTAKLLIHSSATLYGAAVSYSSLRTNKVNMQRLNKIEVIDPDEFDNKYNPPLVTLSPA